MCLCLCIHELELRALTGTGEGKKLCTTWIPYQHGPPRQVVHHCSWCQRRQIFCHSLNCWCPVGRWALLSSTKRTPSDVKEDLALSGYLILTPRFGLTCKAPCARWMLLCLLEWIDRIVPRASEVAGAGELRPPSGSKQPWQHALSCFLKSAAVSTKPGSSVLPTLLWTHLPLLPSCSATLSYKHPAILLFIQFFPLLYWVAQHHQQVLFPPLSILQMNITDCENLVVLVSGAWML